MSSKSPSDSDRKQLNIEMWENGQDPRIRRIPIANNILLDDLSCEGSPKNSIPTENPGLFKEVWEDNEFDKYSTQESHQESLQDSPQDSIGTCF